MTSGWAWRSGVAAVVVAGACAWCSPPGERVAAQLDEASYRHVLDNLLFTHYGDSRGIFGAEHDPARDNIRAELASYGLACHLESFFYKGNVGENVVAELTGISRPSEIYIIGAHYDSVDNPGADDNGSGVAGVLEIARIMSQYESEATIRFIAFDMEEIGLAGAEDYVAHHGDEDIRGMVSMDMIAYDPSGVRAARLYGRKILIKETLADALLEYAGITTTIGSRRNASDHAPFDLAGFQACWLAEHDVWVNPLYHQWNDSVDTPGYIDYAYATDMSRGVAGWLTDVAGVLDCPGDMNRDGLVDTRDVFAFLNAWAAGDPGADWNRDGSVDTLDVTAFLNAWAAGC